MAPPKGNQFWKVRSSHGPNPKFANSDDLWAACEEYFQWVEDNPLKEEKGFAFQGVVTKESFSKMRPMTIGGLCVFLDVEEKTWRNWRDGRKDLLPIITRVEGIIYQQKFAGAAADLLNPSIIARDLGLKDRTEIGGDPNNPIKTEEVGGGEKLKAFLAGIEERSGTVSSAE